MSKKRFIDSVQVKSPCTEDWENMHGSDRVRFCDHCAKDVHNISEMTRKQAMRLVRASGGNLCIRYVQDPVTKRPLFAEHLLQITRRTPGVAAGVMTASVSLSTVAYAQGEPIPPPSAPPVATARPDKNGDTVRRERSSGPEASLGKIVGKVADTNGAVIPNSVITLQNMSTQETAEVSTDETGDFEFSDLKPGNYKLTASSPGFSRQLRENIEVSETEVVVDLEMQPAAFLGGVMVSIEYKLPLAQAVADEDSDLVRELIAKGENVNGKDENYDKITPLFVAVDGANLEIIQLLLDAGAKVNARDGERQTPLMRLDDEATPELVELLLRHGAKINLTDNDNNTALINVAERVAPEVLKTLIDAGADVNVVNKAGQTALMRAASADSLEKVRMLLEAGARANVKDQEGDNAWDMASDEEVREILARYGADVKTMPIETTSGPQEVSVPDAM